MTGRSARWDRDDIGDLDGRVALVTGASDGLGLAVTKRLNRAGATVVMACRNETKAERARSDLPTPDTAEITIVDLADPGSIDEMADRFLADHDRLDLLINNAGVMTPPPTLTPAGYELQWATNHLGHFALTGLLLERLDETDDSRVVTVSSLAAVSGQFHRYDPTTLRGHRRFQAYANSKRANLVFTVELDRRLRRAGSHVVAVAAHPGLASTNLASGFGLPIPDSILRAFTRVIAQSVDAGADPILRAATDPATEGGWYYGPSGPGEQRGRAVKIRLPAGVSDRDRAAALWDESIEQTGVEYLID